MSVYDKDFTQNIIQTINEHIHELDHCPDHVKDWFNEIKHYCELSLDLFFNDIPQDTPFYANTPVGETLSAMTFQYRFDDDFNIPLTRILFDIGLERDVIIQNHLPQTPFPHHHHNHLYLH